MNIMMLLEMAAEACGEREAFWCDGDSLTYAELYAAAGQAARLIRDSGCNHVVMIDESGLAAPIAIFGSAWAGVPYVPLNYRLTKQEIAALLRRLESAYLIQGWQFEESLSFSGYSTHSGEFLSETRVSTPLSQDWSMEPSAIAVNLFTSGTTGQPKAAILRQQHLVNYILGSGEFMSASSADTTLSCVPPYHIAGIASVISSVYAGRRVVQLPAFDAQKWLALCAGQNVTTAFLVPTMLTRIVEAIESGANAELPTLHAISYGGGKMPLATIERAMNHFTQVQFTNAYGLTETSSTVSLLSPDAHKRAFASPKPEERRRLSSVGRALPGIEIEIRNEQGLTLGPDEWGEVYVRGEQVSGEYAGKGSSLDSEGWFPTRDAGQVDSEGYLFLDGRADDVIVRGGENISPGEIEDVLLSHPAVRDVGVVGYPDEQWGESVAAAVVLGVNTSVSACELQSWIREHLRSSRVPQKISFCEQLPYNETGKLLRREIRAAMSA